MPPEAALLESRALRDSVRSHTDALDRAKALFLLPDDIHITTVVVADYFEVGIEAVKSLVKDHREELTTSGYRILAGQELRAFKALSGIHSRASWIALFPRRVVLNVAMLLQDSPITRSVRVHLLDIETERHQPTRPYWAAPPRQRRGPGPRWDEYDYLRAHPQAAAPEHYQAPDQGGWSGPPDHGRVIGAMSDQLLRVSEDVRELRAELSGVHADMDELRRRAARSANPRRRR